MLKELISSKTERKLLTMFLTQPDSKFYLRQLARLTNEPVGALQRELPRLEKIGLIQSEYNGRVKNYIVDKKCPLFEELKSIILKTAEAGD